MSLTVSSQTPVAVGCVHPTTRQRAWSAVEQRPRHPHEPPASRENSSTTLADGPKHDAGGTEAKQVLLWKGWVLKQRLNHVQSRVGATATRAHVEAPLRTEPFVDSCSARHQGNCCASTCETPATRTSIRTRLTKMFMRQDCCARTPQAHLDLSPCAQRHVPAKRLLHLTPRAHLDLSPCVHATTLLHSRAVSTLGSLPTRKLTCSVEKTAAFCIRTPRAHLDLTPCAKRHVPPKRLLLSHKEMYEHCAAIEGGAA